MTSLAAAMLLFNFGFSSASSACETHGDDEASGGGIAAAHDHSTNAADAHRGHAAIVADHGTADDAEPCEIPSRPVCCKAVGSCTVSFSVNDAELVADMAVARVAVAIQGAAAPMSLSHPPEPPPPKA